MARTSKSHRSRVDDIYAARDAAVTALEEEDYGEALRLLALLTDLRAALLPTAKARHQLLTEIATILRAVHQLEENLGLDSDVDEP